MVEFHHSPYCVVLALQLTKALFIQVRRTDGRLAGNYRLHRFNLVSMLILFYSRDHGVCIGLVPISHVRLFRDSGADEDHGTYTLRQCLGLFLGDEPGVKPGTDCAEYG